MLTLKLTWFWKVPLATAAFLKKLTLTEVFGSCDHTAVFRGPDTHNYLDNQSQHLPCQKVVRTATSSLRGPWAFSAFALGAAVFIGSYRVRSEESVLYLPWKQSAREKKAVAETETKTMKKWQSGQGKGALVWLAVRNQVTLGMGQDTKAAGTSKVTSRTSGEEWPLSL